MRWLVGDEFASVSAMSNDVLTKGTAYNIRFLRALLQLGLHAKCALVPAQKFHALNVYGSQANIQTTFRMRSCTGDRDEDENR